MSLDFGVRWRAKQVAALDKLIRDRKRSRMQNQSAVPDAAGLCRRTPNRRKMILNRLAQLVVVLLCAASIKWYYSTASVNELRWILAPTTALVELISGMRFEFESHAGYMSSDHTYLIAASCAGVNFLITAFLMLSLGKLWRARARQIPWSFFAGVAVVAYFATLVANTVRISFSLFLRGMHLEFGLTANQMHRFEGIFLYFGFLLLLFLLSDRFGWLSSGERPLSERLQANSRSHRFVLIRRFLLPLLVYYAITLGIPFANGAHDRGSAFLEHSFYVLLTPLLLLLPVITFQFYLEGRVRSERKMDVAAPSLGDYRSRHRAD